MIVNNPCNIYVEFAEPERYIIVWGWRGKCKDTVYFREFRPKQISCNFNVTEELCPIDITFSRPVVNVRFSSLKQQLKRTVNFGKPDYDYSSNRSTITVDPRQLSPAIIYPQTGKIVVNAAFADYPYPVKMFILAHERGHTLFKDETRADLYAMQELLARGHNYSCIDASLRNVLRASPEKRRRLRIIERHLLANDYR